MKPQYFLLLTALWFSLAGCAKKDEVANVKCCNDKDYKVINPSHKLIIANPNVITPNNDGLNDSFVVYALDTTTKPSARAVFTVQKLRLYRSDNTLIYQNNNYLNNFDGHDNNGREISEGTYRYELELDDNTVTGNLCIVRSQKPCPCRPIDPVDPALSTCRVKSVRFNCCHA